MKTPQDQVRGGREEERISPSCVLIQIVRTTCQRIHNSLSAAEMSLCSDSVNK